MMPSAYSAMYSGAPCCRAVVTVSNHSGPLPP